MFEDLGMPRIISMIDPQNAASIRVAEKLGERIDGKYLSKGNDLLIYAMSRDEFVLHKGPNKKEPRSKLRGSCFSECAF